MSFNPADYPEGEEFIATIRVTRYDSYGGSMWHVISSNGFVGSKGILSIEPAPVELEVGQLYGDPESMFLIHITNKQQYQVIRLSKGTYVSSKVLIADLDSTVRARLEKMEVTRVG